MKPFLVLIFLAAAQSALASTWKDEGSTAELTAKLMIDFKSAKLCELKPDDATVHSVYSGGGTIFVLFNDGSIEALKNMLAERFALDYCWN